MPYKVALPVGWGLLMSSGVSKEAQNMGVGRPLAVAFLEEATQRGLNKIYLSTDMNNNNKVNAYIRK